MKTLVKIFMHPMQEYMHLLPAVQRACCAARARDFGQLSSGQKLPSWPALYGLSALQYHKLMTVGLKSGFRV